MAITTATLVLSAGLSIYLQTQHFRENVNEQVTSLAEMLSQNIQPLLLANHGSFNPSPQILAAAKASFDSLNTIPMITNVHVYSIDKSDSPALFHTYNKQGYTPVETKVSNLSGYYTPKFNHDVVEIIRPITDESTHTTLGYLYLRASAEDINTFIADSMLIHFSILIFMLLVGFYLSYKLVNDFSLPIEKLGLMLQKISRNRDYSKRTEPSNIIELNSLSDTINIMLSRIQDYLARQQESEEAHKKLNIRLEEMVNERTLALKTANQELIQTLEKLHQFQRQMVQNEKMASLGDMVAGIAHEVNTPIGLGVTASTMMLDRLATIDEQFQNKTLKASTMAKFISESQENLGIIYRNLNRAAGLISSFKQVAVDQTTENNRNINVTKLIDEILVSLRPRLKKVKHQINVHCDEDLVVETNPGPIEQILINLIMNSIIHAFDGVENGTIDIIVELVSQQKLKITYKDNGIGIPNDIKKRIFDPFVTTKRGQGGSGLGMHLVYNLVTQALNGSISLSTEDGNGVEFVIMFPIKLENK
jgi:signal transduction histidine kinase